MNQSYYITCMYCLAKYISAKLQMTSNFMLISTDIYVLCQVEKKTKFSSLRIQPFVLKTSFGLLFFLL